MRTTVIRAAVVVAALPLAAGAFAQSLGIQPGQWEIVSTTTAAEMPGAPAGVADMMRGRSITVRHCITPREAAEGPQAAMKKNNSCRVSYHVGAGGRFTSEMSCAEGGGTMTANSAGTVNATSFSSTTRMVMAGAAAMTITSTATGRKGGECKG